LYILTFKSWDILGGWNWSRSLGSLKTALSVRIRFCRHCTVVTGAYRAPARSSTSRI
jgi:hypothetical protein